MSDSCRQRCSNCPYIYLLSRDSYLAPTISRIIATWKLLNDAISMPGWESADELKIGFMPQIAARLPQSCVDYGSADVDYNPTAFDHFNNETNIHNTLWLVAYSRSGVWWFSIRVNNEKRKVLKTKPYRKPSRNPIAVAVSPYDWLMVSYGCLAGLSDLRVRLGEAGTRKMRT